MIASVGSLVIFEFLSTLSLRRATYWATRARAAQLFLSTLSLRRATKICCLRNKRKKFLSTLSLRRATHNRRVNLFGFQNFYPRSPCGERPVPNRPKGQKQNISIHALLAESDKLTAFQSGLLLDFYPRSPCGERHLGVSIIQLIEHFYPRSPCGERHG